jgi:hypothetical protein
MRFFCLFQQSDAKDTEHTVYAPICYYENSYTVGNHHPIENTISVIIDALIGVLIVIFTH